MFRNVAYEHWIVSFSPKKVFMRLKKSLRLKRGHTLLEAMFASFLALICALIFAATVPLANFTRGKAENINLAVSLAQKTAETVKASGYPNVTAQRMFDNSLIDSMTQQNIGAFPFGNTGEMAYPAIDVDNALVDSPSKILPEGRGYVITNQADLDLRRITVVIAWKERSVWKSVRVSTLVANL